MRLIRSIPVFCAMIFLSSPASGLAKDERNSPTGSGQVSRLSNLVPNERTAVAIAIAVLKQRYGDKVIEKQMPFHGTLIDTKWTVEGTLPRGYLGGVATIEISKDDGRIFDVYHTQ